MCHTQLCSASLSLIAFCPATRCWEMFPLILSDHPDCESQLCCPVVLKTKNNRSFMCAMHRQHNKGHCSMLWLERNPFAYKSCWYHTNLQQPICLERNLILRASWMKSVSQPRAIGCIVMTFLYRHLFPLITLTTTVSIHPIVWFITRYLRTRGCCTRGCWSINIMKSSATLQLRGKKPFLSVCAFLSWNVPRDDAMHTSQTQSQCQRAEMWCSNAKGSFH